MKASNLGHTATVQALLEEGADPSIRNKVFGTFTPHLLFINSARISLCFGISITTRMLRMKPRPKRSGR
jgi:ankyrin repeat protein